MDLNKCVRPFAPRLYCDRLILNPPAPFPPVRRSRGPPLMIDPEMSEIDRWRSFLTMRPGRRGRVGRPNGTIHPQNDDDGHLAQGRARRTVGRTEGFTPRMTMKDTWPKDGPAGRSDGLTDSPPERR